MARQARLNIDDLIQIHEAQKAAVMDRIGRPVFFSSYDSKKGRRPLEERSYAAYSETALTALQEALKTFGQDYEVNSHDLLEQDYIIYCLKRYMRGLGREITHRDWRGRKSAIAVRLFAAGYVKAAQAVRAFVNSVPPKLRPKAGKQKAKHVQLVTESQHNAMLEHARKRKARYKNPDSPRARAAAFDEASLVLLWTLGIRPWELNRIELAQYDDAGERVKITVNIRSAKQLAEGSPYKRSIEVRTLSFDMAEDAAYEFAQAITTAQAYLGGMSENEKIQALENQAKRIGEASRQLWPKRKQQVCRYSYRYTMGSRLKTYYKAREERLTARGITPMYGYEEIVSAAMGHRNLDSADKYGSYKADVQGGGTIIQPSGKTVTQVKDNRNEKRVNHDKAPAHVKKRSAKRAAIRKARQARARKAKQNQRAANQAKPQKAVKQQATAKKEPRKLSPKEQVLARLAMGPTMKLDKGPYYSGSTPRGVTGGMDPGRIVSREPQGLTEEEIVNYESKPSSDGGEAPRPPSRR